MKIAFAEALGFLILLPACILHVWTNPITRTTKPLPARLYIDRWSWNWLNAWYGNVEDGVSGQQARVWNSTGTALIPYGSLYPNWMPEAIVAYGWSAWRNGANNLKRASR